MVDPNLIQASSKTAGLQDKGLQPDASTTISGPIPTNSSIRQDLTVPVSQKEAMAYTQVQFQNTGDANIDNFWWPVSGSMRLNVSGNSYFIWAIIQNSPAGRIIQLELINNLAGAPVSIPTITVTGRARLYNYPWQ